MSEARPGITFDKRLPRRRAHEMVLMFAKHGNHYGKGKFRTDAEVKRFLSQKGYDFNGVVENARDFFENAVPFFENFVGATFHFHVSSEGPSSAKASLIEKGEPVATIDTPGEISVAYQALFEHAVRCINRIPENPVSLYQEFLAACSAGISSIEAYMRHRADLWNREHPDDLLLDDKDHKISLEDQIDRWVPKMTGKRLDKSGSDWQGYRKIKSLRDNQAIHPKSGGLSMSLGDLAKSINDFCGIAGVLIQLHILFEEQIPRAIIRRYFHPDAKVL